MTWVCWCGAVLERFRAKWIPVRVKKTRQNKKLEPGSDSIRTGNALARVASPGGSQSEIFQWRTAERALEHQRERRRIFVAEIDRDRGDRLARGKPRQRADQAGLLAPGHE